MRRHHYTPRMGVVGTVALMVQWRPCVATSSFASIMRVIKHEAAVFTRLTVAAEERWTT